MCRGGQLQASSCPSSPGVASFQRGSPRTAQPRLCAELVFCFTSMLHLDKGARQCRNCRSSSRSVWPLDTDSLLYEQTIWAHWKEA